MHRFFNAEFTALKVKIAQHGPVSTDQLDSLHRLLTQCHNRRLTIDVLGLKSIAAARDGNIESALSLLREALFLAQPGQLIRPLADLGPEIAKLLGRLNLDQEGSRYAGLITSALREPIEALTEHQPLPEPLSQREFEILALLAQDLSNKEIATRLFISIGTVKQHTHNIYGKLSVNRRRAAVLKAQSLSLLEKA
jgi:LuxR family maltose regulon positive regulatory protein